eukprot:symbB.v1.2.025027.t1/scaffold2408.1/size79997/1
MQLQQLQMQMAQMAAAAPMPQQMPAPMAPPMGMMSLVPAPAATAPPAATGTRRASLAFGSVQGAPAQQLSIPAQPATVLPAFQEGSDEDEEGFSDSSDEDEGGKEGKDGKNRKEDDASDIKSPTGGVPGVLKNSSSSGAEQPDMQGGPPKPPSMKNVQLKIAEADKEDEESFCPSSKSSEAGSFGNNWTLKAAAPTEGAEASRLSSMRSRAWQEDLERMINKPKSRYVLMPDSLFCERIYSPSTPPKFQS